MPRTWGSKIQIRKIREFHVLSGIAKSNQLAKAGTERELARGKVTSDDRGGIKAQMEEDEGGGEEGTRYRYWKGSEVE